MDDEDLLGGELEEGGTSFNAAAADDDVDFEDIDEDLMKFKDDDLVKDALRTGADLKQYAKRIEEDLRAVERASIHDYLKESENLAQLHSEIRSCDSILERMESMLGGFQSDLGKISAEIKHLQEQSLSMNAKLRNRRAAEEKIASFIDGVAVSPKLIHAICENEVNEAYLEYLLVLKKKFSFCETTIAKESVAARDIEPEIEKLRLRAVDKVREFLLHKINSLGKPHTNFQILQQSVLLKFKYFAQFLRDHATSAFEEVRGAYVDTMQRIFLAYFRGHARNMNRIMLEVGSERLVDDDRNLGNLGKVIGNLGNLGNFGFGGGAKPARQRDAAFVLGDRAAVLNDVGKPALIFHVELENQRRHPLEVVFRSVTHLVVDAATSEHLFAADFFADPSLFPAIFKPTLACIREQIEADLAACTDAVGLLLVLRILEEHRKIMQKRRINVLDSFLESLAMVVWPRIKAAIDHHVSACRAAPLPALLHPHVDKEPHYVVRRFAELSAAMHCLNSEEKADTLDRSIDYLSTEVEKLMRRIGAEISPRRRQLVFFINQYDLIRTTYTERGVPAAKCTRYDELMQIEVNAFIEEELSLSYPLLYKFVKKRQDLDPSNRIPIDSSTVQPIVSDFSAHWKTGIDQINTNVMSNFKNMRNGMDILKQVLSQLLVIYSNFLEEIKRDCKDSQSLIKDAVSIPTFLYEIKKYSRTL